MAATSQDATRLQEGSRAALWLPLVVIIAVSLGVYFNALFNGWVLDDFPQILNNSWVKSTQYTREIFSSNAWAFDARDSSYYRPLIQIIYMITYYIFGLRPWAFHLINLLFHTTISVIVFVIILRLLKESSNRDSSGFLPALFGALLFAVHPIHTEVVAPVMGMHDLSFSLFYLLSFYLYMQRVEGSRVIYCCSVASFLVAILCKEPAITLPAMLACYDALIKKERVFTFSAFKRYLPYGVVIAIYLVMRFHALGGAVQNQYSEAQMSTYVYLINVFPLFARYLEKLITPVSLNLVYIYHPVHSILESKAFLSLAASGLFAVLVWFAAKKNRVAFFGCLFILLPLLPALYLPGLNQRIEVAFAERYLYLPSFGLVLLISLLLDSVIASRQKWSIALTAAIVLVIMLFGLGTIYRNPDWKNNYTLWTDAVKKSPESPAAHRDLGYALLYYKKDTEGARREFDLAVKLQPELPEGAIRAGVAYAQKGMIDKAIFQFHAALLLKPDSTEAHYNLALAYDEKGWPNEAMNEYETVLRLQPQHANAHNNLGIIYAKRGFLDKAREHFRQAVSLKPSDADFRSNLAKAENFGK